MTRPLRRFVALALLALSVGACEMTVDVATRVGDDGTGSFRIVFAFDEEFIDVVRSTDEGAATLDELADTGAQFAGSGWIVRQTQPDGGLRIDISRTFKDPEELEAAIRDVADRSGDRALAFPTVFRDVRLDHSSSFFRASAGVTGTVDLTPERLVPGAEAGEQLREALKRAARDVFRFRVRLDLPGRVGEYRGDPESVAGGTIVWAIPFGETLEFAASSSGYKTSSLLIVGGPVVALIVAAATVLLLRRRRDRNAPIPGWEVAEKSEATPTHGGSA
ncbi:MAG TPA: hypothetical protein VGB64_14875 [Actinomycetota bacterium]